MAKSERVSQLSEGFAQLPAEGQDYMLAILQALSFAKNMSLEPSQKSSNETKSA